MANGPSKIAKFDDYKRQLFDLYTRPRYSELICDGLMRGAVKVEKVVRWSVLILVAIALLSQATEGFYPSVLKPIGIAFDVLATLVALYSLIVASGAKQFTWFALASKFAALATEVEFFSEYVRLGKITEDELLDTWKGFSEKMGDLLDQGGVELREYAKKHGEPLRDKLAITLKKEGRAV
jgi:hypothetical protein